MANETFGLGRLWDQQTQSRGPYHCLPRALVKTPLALGLIILVETVDSPFLGCEDKRNH